MLDGLLSSAGFLSSGGTIGGDLTISGDLTVSGSSTYTYDEQVDGIVYIKDSTASSATQGGHLRLFSDDGAVMASGHRLGVLEFGGAEDTSSTITVGARIEALTDATWSASENGAYLSFYTTDGDASQSEAMRLNADNTVLFYGDMSIQSSGGSLTVKSTDSSDGDADISLVSDAGAANEDFWKIKNEGSNNNLQFENNGNARLVIEHAGNVGIGITDPAHPLHIYEDNATTSTAGILIEQDGSGDCLLSFLTTGIQRWVTGIDTTDSFYKIASTSNLGTDTVLTLDTSGNVGIGETAPDRILHIKGTSPAIRTEHTSTGDSAWGQIEFYATTTSMGNIGFGSTANSDMDILNNVSGGNIDFTTTGAGTFNFITGNVGIGSATPTHGKLEIVGASDDFQIVMSDVADADDTIKEARIGMMHYKQAEEPVTLMYAQSASSENAIYIGGGTGVGNHATSVLIATASTYNSTSTTTNMKIDNNSRISLSNNDSGGTGGEDSTSGNTLLGYLSGAAIASGGLNNTAIGHKALNANTVGDNNIAIGVNSMVDANLEAIDGNVCVGNNTGGSFGTVGVYGTTLIGDSAGSSINAAAAFGTTCVGQSAGTSISSGEGNTAVGYLALDASTNSDFSTAIGANALSAQTGTTGTVGNTAVGYNAGLSITTGVANTAIGYLAGDAMNEGHNNVAVGNGSLGLSTTIGYSVAIGDSAMAALATVDGTVAIGASALAALTSGAGNTAVGYNSLLTTATGAKNTAIGYEALKLAIDGGDQCTAVGYMALDAANNQYSDKNTAVGSDALGANTSGQQNTGLGANTGATLTTGDACVILGENSDVSTADAQNQIIIGQGVTGVGNNSVTLGNASVTAVYMASDSGATVHAAGVVVTTGINFPDDASANPSADVNTLDNYEEGTWTPTGTGSANWGSGTGTYTKIGDTVVCHGELTATADGANDSLASFPFTAGARYGMGTGFESANTGHTIQARITGGATVGHIRQHVNGNSWSENDLCKFTVPYKAV